LPIYSQSGLRRLINTLSENKIMHFRWKINDIFLIIQFANLFKRKSIKNPEGFPTTMGSFCTEQLTAATIVPAPVEVSDCKLYRATCYGLKLQNFQ
jgi:hypothetical protein